MRTIDPERVHHELHLANDRKLDEACAAISNRVYAASVAVFEKLETEGYVVGNGHHMAQKLAMKAQAMVVERWASLQVDE